MCACSECFAHDTDEMCLLPFLDTHPSRALKFGGSCIVFVCVCVLGSNKNKVPEGIGFAPNPSYTLPCMSGNGTVQSRYLQTHDVNGIIKQAVAALLRHCPSDPVRQLAMYFGANNNTSTQATTSAACRYDDRLGDFVAGHHPPAGVADSSLASPRASWIATKQASSQNVQREAEVESVLAAVKASCLDSGMPLDVLLHRLEIGRDFLDVLCSQLLDEWKPSRRGYPAIPLRVRV